MRVNAHKLVIAIVLAARGVSCAQERFCLYQDESESVNTRIAQSGDFTQADRTLFIPVVFHIVYNNSAQNISDAQIYSQLNVINEDFARKNADSTNTLKQFAGVAASAHIQFYLAQRDGVVGITRTATSHTLFHNDDLHVTSLGGRDAWDTGKYLNVWVAPLAPGISGYGSPPGSPAFRDGVAVHFEYFGRQAGALAPFHLGRTLTHEIGHWLGLQHLWGTGGCDSDDGLTDTPRQSGATSGCALSQVTCGELNMIQNFMNTSDDACMNLFTVQQVARMRTTLINDRAGVYSDSELVTAVELPQGNLKFYPNPIGRNGVASISHAGIDIQRLIVIDSYGRKVRDFGLYKSDRDAQLDFAGLDDGMYVILIYQGSDISSIKVILDTGK